jgi:F0F1-type ATP synthase membrane subunit b/b'
MKIKLKLLWLWLEKNGLHLFYGISLLFSIILGVKFKEILDEKNQLLNKNKEEAEKLRQAELKAKEREEQIRKTYEQTIKDIKAHNDAELKTIASQKDKEIKELSERFADNPELMADEINKLFNIPIYPKQ